MHLVDVEFEKNVLEVNKKLAEENAKILKEYGIKSYDFMGAIGSGKTALIYQISKKILDNGLRVAAITGDVAGDEDAVRLRELSIPVVNITTGKDCHLDAHRVMHALEKLPLDEIDVLFVENVGNLVCPADFPLGTDKRVVVISVTEGDDMVVKHPYIFMVADVAVLNKIDLAEYLNVSLQRIKEDYRKVKPNSDIIFTSARTGEGIEELMKALGL